MADQKDEPKRYRVLCVVPDTDTFELLRTQLLDHCSRYEADHAATAGSALEAARARHYDIFILDNWWLTDGDGIELCREIRKRDETIPILFYSSNVLPSEIARALAAGAQDYIALPDASGELPRRVEQLLDATRNREASREETRCIRELLIEQTVKTDGMSEAAAKHLDEVLESALRDHALADFIRAGGKRVLFDQLWPPASRDAGVVPKSTRTGTA
jgi:DNA-binding response OmpR family regulator